MPTMQPRPWSTQYKDTYKNKKKRTKRVTIKATPITYPITPNYKDWSAGRSTSLPRDRSEPIGQDEVKCNKRQKEVDSDPHWSEWPESKAIDVNIQPPLRPYSSPGIHRVPTPYHSGPGDIEDRPHTVQPSYLFGDSEVQEKGAPLTFVPELNSWVTNATTDYEKDAAYKVSKTMQRGVISTPFQRSRSVSPMRTRPYYGRSVSYGEGFGYPLSDMAYAQSYNPYSGMPNPSDRVMSGMVRHLEGATPLANYTMYPQSARESRPMARHLRRGSLNQGYVHDLSCFQSTQPMVTGHFVIHPDWVSERMTPRRKPAKKSKIQY